MTSRPYNKLHKQVPAPAYHPCPRCGRVALPAWKRAQGMTCGQCSNRVEGRTMTDDAITALGEEFKRQGLFGHAGKLRAFWQSRHGGPLTEWNEEHVEHLAAILRVPPFQDVIPLQPRGYHCPCITTHYTHLDQRTAHVVGDTAEVWCVSCGAKWSEKALLSNRVAT